MVNFCNVRHLLKPGIAFLLCLFTISNGFAQSRMLTGKVSGTQNEPLPGVNVVVKGTLNGTVTDVDGNFRLEAAASDILVFSFVGFSEQEITVGNQTVINVILKESTRDLDEIVVVGYGVQRKSLVTGAISSVKADDLAAIPATRVEQALQGRTAGVSIMPTSGSPGAGAKLRIRGTNTNGNANPLFIVDGMKTGSIDNIEPADIESIEILKDAASAAIYGTEGANGVIIISTKKGKSGEGVISYDFQYGIQSVKTKMELMNAQEYKKYMEESGINITLPAGTGNGTNWLDEIFETAPMQKHHLSFSGGNDRTSYLTSGSYVSQDGVVGGKSASYERFTFRLNGTHKVKEWFEIGNTLSFSHSTRRSIGEDDEYRGILNNALLMDPATPVKYAIGREPQKIKDLVESGQTILQDSKGRYYALPLYVTGETGNPVALLQTYKGRFTQDKLLSTFYGTIKPMKGLSLTSRFGVDLTYQQNHSWNPKYYFSSERNNGINSITDNIDKYFSWLWENFGTYNIKIGDHDVTALLGYSAEKYQHPSFYLYSAPMAKEGDAYSYHSHTTSRENDRVGSDMSEQTMTSIFSRISYNYMGRYMVEASIRRDAASVFPTNKKAAVFPALSAGWIVSEEGFWGFDAINYLKARVSWGQNGSKSNLPGNEDKEFWTVSGVFYPNPTGGLYSGAEIDKLTNDNLKWERTEQLAIGLDFRFLDSKIAFSADYYNKKTRDLIIIPSLPLSVGNDFPFMNGGDVTNKGFEFELGYNDQFGDLKFSANLNLSTLKNEVTKLAVDAPVAGANVRGYDLSWFEQGKPIWYFSGYKTKGINKTTGMPNIVDVSKDGNITAADITMIGDPHPDFLFGANFTAEYKNFDLGIFLQGTYGNDIYTAWFRPDRAESNKPRYMYTNRWTPSNTNASWPKADNSSEYIYRSDFMIQDGSYMRIKQIQLGYTMPKNLIQKVGLNKTRVYVSLDDFFTFTKYKGLDPESGSNNDRSQGIDRGVYPIPRKVMFGLSVNF